MKLMNYMNLNQHPVQLSLYKDRTHEFAEIYHAHQGMEMLYVHQGTGTAIAQQQIFEMSPGTLIFFKPFQLHRIRVNVSPQQPYIRSLAVFEPAVLDEALAPFPGLRAFFQTLWKDPLAPQILLSPDPHKTETLLRTYIPLLTQTSSELLEEQLLFLISYLHHWKSSADHTRSERHKPVKTSSTAEKVMAWIEAHFMEPFELSRLAQEVHLSPNHVSAVFKQSVGSSITEYLSARRIRQACWLLKTSELSVQEIGQAVGLGNFSYFCQLFKKHVGLTPNGFKQQPISVDRPMQSARF